MGQRVTSADVARMAGVSRATVSYVLNDTPHQTISEGTRGRVLSAAAALGYAPSAAARALRTGRSDVVLCLLPDWPIGDEVGALLSNLSSAFARRGLTFVVHPASRDDRPISELWKALTPAAVLAFGDFSDLSEEELSAMRAAGVAPVVPLAGGSGGARRELDPAQQRVGRLQAQYLAGLGHTILGYAYPDDHRLRFFADPRLAGVRSGCSALSLDPPSVATVPLSPGAAVAAVESWRARGVTAVCAYNDEVALAVLAGVRLAGLRAPEDLAVIGVDDIPAARLADPPLTTVTTDQGAVAVHLAASVVDAIVGKQTAREKPLDAVAVVARASA
jgi:DNA-binding LacI/PurR family transcriptional regulator